jgi:hypothetical protein
VLGVATASDPAFLALHALRLKGFADVAAVAALTGLELSDAERALAAAAEEKLVTHRDGRVTGWSITAAGRQRHRELIRAELDAAGTRQLIEASYATFLSVNTDLLEVCTAWQLRNGVPNDHADADYDARVVSRLGSVDDVIQPVCNDLAKALARFGDYGRRLADARARVEAGDGDWFTKPMIDSYHTVWFELHEDLLATLGIERSKGTDH